MNGSEAKKKTYFDCMIFHSLLLLYLFVTCTSCSSVRYFKLKERTSLSCTSLTKIPSFSVLCYVMLITRTSEDYEITCSIFPVSNGMAVSGHLVHTAHVNSLPLTYGLHGSEPHAPSTK